MSWIAEDRRHARLESGQPLLTEEMQRHVREVLFPRYPTKRACLLPVLHLVQHEYNWIPPEAMQEVAELLELAPAEVLDTASFYEEYWLKKRGKYLIGVCRSLACEVCGSDRIIEGLVEKLGVEVGETTDDERFTLIEMECLGSCGTAPVALVNELLHEEITLEGLLSHLQTVPDDPHDYRDPVITFDLPHGNAPGNGGIEPQGATVAAPAKARKAPAKKGRGKKKGGEA